MYDIAVIGAGVCGASIARELSRYDLKIIILDREKDVSCGASKANSAIIHAGYDPGEETLMARLNAAANPMFDRICSELDVPFRRNGSLVVAFNDEEMNRIRQLYKRGINNRIPGLRIISKTELLEKEPAVNPEAIGALFSGTAGIIDPMLLTISLTENALSNGCDIRLDFNVQSIEKAENRFIISSSSESVEAGYVVNAAGVYADRIHNMAAEPCFKIKPRRGQYYVLDKNDGSIVHSVIFPCPSKMGKGTLVTPTVHGNLLLGPSSDDLSDPDDLSTTEELLEEAGSGAKKLIPEITVRNSIRTFAGIRAQPDTGDFIIKEADDAPGFIDAAGIKSPGLTAAPAIALMVIDMLDKKGALRKKKSDFNPYVKRRLFHELNPDEQQELIGKNPLYGRVICRCENITEGDITDAVRRPAGAVTLDGVKRRCRPGMGRCQGGFCGPRVQEILARELNLPLEEVVLEKSGSYILTGKTK